MDSWLVESQFVYTRQVRTETALETLIEEHVGPGAL